MLPCAAGVAWDGVRRPGIPRLPLEQLRGECRARRPATLLPSYGLLRRPQARRTPRPPCDFASRRYRMPKRFGLVAPQVFVPLHEYPQDLKASPKPGCPS